MEGMGDETRAEAEDEAVEVGRGTEVQGSIEEVIDGWCGAEDLLIFVHFSSSPSGDGDTQMQYHFVYSWVSVDEW
ncbi:hypothetical protein E2C01_001025 [Portunus trituberculatus]|uniref:Uncharacterized protein n=1 Tax=Portunus trituberculatus TaxID=210409 RepID=A0A5B7CGN2_PORTR|nr:hypothetical protein [Portunus trituberculatus]